MCRYGIATFQVFHSPSVTFQVAGKSLPLALRYVPGRRKEPSTRPPLRYDLASGTFRRPSTPLRPRFRHIPPPFHSTTTSWKTFLFCNSIAAARRAIRVCCNRALLCVVAAPTLIVVYATMFHVEQQNQITNVIFTNVILTNVILTNVNSCLCNHLQM